MQAESGDTRDASNDARLAGTASDRLWPVLLDRLTDTEPEKTRESLQSRVMTRNAYRADVLRDLQWLLNSTNLDASIDFTGYPDAQRSVLNFGIGALSGRLASNVDRGQVETSIRDAILAFEPRILPHTVEVQVTASDRTMDVHNQLSIVIRGELWSIPYPMEVLLRSDIDLETGQVVLHDQSRSE